MSVFSVYKFTGHKRNTIDFHVSQSRRFVLGIKWKRKPYNLLKWSLVLDLTPGDCASTVNPVLSPPSLISPPFQRRNINKPPSLLRPPPHSLFFTKKLTINVDWSVMVYSGWKFILFLVFGRMTSNFICLTFSTLHSSSLWRIVTIFLSLDKAVYRPGTTSPSSRNLAP